MEATHNHQGILSPSLSQGDGEEEMVIERVHGMDRHKRFTTISVLNREGKEVRLEGACWDPKEYMQGLGTSLPVVPKMP
jgi:hypothetical protein